MKDSYDVYNSDSNRGQLKTAFMYISLVQKLVNNRDSYALGEKYAKYSYLKDFKTLKDLVDRTYKYCKECVESTVTKDTYSDYHSKMSIMMDYLERIHSIGMDMMSDSAFDMLENL